MWRGFRRFPGFRAEGGTEDIDRVQPDTEGLGFLAYCSVVSIPTRKPKD